jgi:hypothetical protein
MIKRIIIFSIVTTLPINAHASEPENAVVFADRSRGIEVQYAFEPGFVLFSADLPSQWTFFVRLDGDQNGNWGDGPMAPEKVVSHSTADWQIGYDPRDGSLCSQYILASRPQDPSAVLASSTCGSFSSNAVVDIQRAARADHMRLTYRIPAKNLFGALSEAHLQICLWDGRRTDCQHSPVEPIVLRQPVPEAS